MGKKIDSRKKTNILGDTSKPIKDIANDNGVSCTTVRNVVGDGLNDLLDDYGNYIGYEIHQKNGHLVVCRPLLKYQIKPQPLLDYYPLVKPLLRYLV